MMHTRQSRWWALWLGLVCLMSLMGCLGGAQGGGGSGGGTVCEAGATRGCACTTGQMGAQTCDDDGSRWGTCGCGSCTRMCTGRACGDDGCGGQCGACPMGQTCSNGSCVAGTPSCTPACGGRRCGADPACGTSCGTCAAGSTCNPMSGQCCTQQCAGRTCGSDGCGGSCGVCPGGTTCNATSGRCEQVCVPACAGRNCGPDGCGGSCGTCPAPSSCGPAGVCQSTCFANPGEACISDTDCCPGSTGNPSRCVRLTGVGTVCTAACLSGNDCVSGCCVSLTDGTRACNIPLFCASTAACFAGTGQTCGRDADCCRDTVNFNPQACTCLGGACTCRGLCSQDSDCVSQCCARRDDGVRICSPASACGR